MPQIVAQRTMNISYPILDSIFLLGLVILLIVKKKYRPLIWAFAGGVLYFIVDYVGFHLIAGTRQLYWMSDISQTTDTVMLFWTLLWMSMSYGFTNFLLIWLAFDKDEHLIGYVAIIFLWWIACPQISDLFSTAATFTISRTTASYHGIMGIILFASYAVLIIRNMSVPKERRVNIVWLMLIGILVQFGWEFALLISGIRSDGFTMGEALRTLAVNSLTETNLGMPLMFLIYVYLNRWYDKRKSAITGLPLDELMSGRVYCYPVGAYTNFRRADAAGIRTKDPLE